MSEMENLQKANDGRDAQAAKDPCVEWVVKQFEWYEKFHEPRFSKMRKIIDYWEGKPSSSVEADWQNNVVVPAMMEAEQTITPRICTALFPTDAPLDIKAEGDTPQEDATIIKFLIQHYFRVSDVQRKSSSMLTQNTLLGTAYAESGSWLNKKGYVIDADTGQRVIRTIDNRPDFQHVDFFEMFPHPSKISMDDGLPVIRRRFIDEEALKSIAENPFFKFDDLKKALEDKNAPKRPSYDGIDAFERKEYEVLDYWGPWDLTFAKQGGAKEETLTQKAVPHWVIIINRKVKVRYIPNPYDHQLPPFVKTNLYPSARPSWFGVGIGEIGLPTQERLNKIVNQRLDNVDLILNKQGVYNGNDPLIKPKQLHVSAPGIWRKVSDVNTSIRWMDTPDVTSSSYKEEELAKNDFRESVGANNALMPSNEPGDQHRTAMGIQLLQGAAGMRLRPVLTNLECDFVAATARFYFSNIKQFMSESEWIEIMGDGVSKMIEVSPDQIQRRVRFVPTGITETVNKETQIGQLLRFKEVTQNDPTINRAEINKRIAELFGFKDTNKLIVAQQAAPMQGPAQPGQMSPEQEQMIKQRMAEGASASQIKMEMLGPPPADHSQEQPA